MTGKTRHRVSFLIDAMYYAAIALAIWIFFKYLLGWFAPFICGFLLAALAQPAAKAAENKFGVPRGAAGVAAVLIYTAVFIGAICLIVTMTAKGLGVNGAGAADKGLLRMFSAISQAADSVPDRAQAYLSGLPEGCAKMLRRVFDNISVQLSGIGSGAAGFVSGAVTRAPGILLGSVVAVVSACFMSRDYTSVTAFAARCLPESWRGAAGEAKGYFFTAIAKLVRAYLKLMLITFCELLVGFLLIGVPGAAAAAALTAFVDLLPVLGTGTVLVPWAAVELLLGNGLRAVCLLILYAVVVVVRNILEPKIVGSHIGLHPLVTLTSMYIGLKAFGFMGMVLFPISVIIIKELRCSGRIKPRGAPNAL